MAYRTKKEKSAFRAGVIVGSRQRKSTSKKKQKNIKPKYLGPVFVNGKYYDTNFDPPHEITKQKLSSIRKEYYLPGDDNSDKALVERYVLHMRAQYGIFDTSDNFKRML